MLMLCGHLLLRNLPCSSPRGSRSSPPIFGPVFSWTKNTKRTVRSVSIHTGKYCWLSQINTSNRTFSMPSRSHLNRPQLLKRQAFAIVWTLSVIVVFRPGGETYLQCLLGSRSRAIALCPQGHLKKRLTASCHRRAWFCSTQRSAGLK